MALNIPMPGVQGDVFGRALDSGTNMFSKFMQPVLEREKQKQLERHFQEQLKLSKASASRASQAAADAHLLAKNKLDPNFEINQIKKIMEFYAGQQNGQQNMGANSEPNNDLLHQKLQSMGMFGQEEMPQGQGMMQMPEERQMDAPQYPVDENAAQGVNGANMQPDLMKMIVGGMLKKKHGFNPFAAPAQTPQEKSAAQLDLFKHKEDIKKLNKGGDTPTNTVLTQNQQALQGIDTVLPMLDELIANPKKIYGRWDFDPSKKAAYNAKTSGMIDTLVAAQSLPKVQASIDLVEQQIRRATNEGDDAYIDRLKDLRKDLVNRRGRAQSVIKNRKVDAAPISDYSKMSDEELHRIARGA